MLFLLLLVRSESARVVQRAEAAWLPAAATPAQVRLRALPRYPRAPALVGVEKVAANGELGALLTRVNADTCGIDETDKLCSFVEGLPEPVLEDLLAVLPDFVDMLPPASLRGVLDDLPDRVLRATAASALPDLAPHFALVGDAALADVAHTLPPEVSAAVRAALVRVFLQLSESVTAQQLTDMAAELPDGLEEDLRRLSEEPESLLEGWASLGVRGPAALRGPPALFGPLAVLAARASDARGLRDLLAGVDTALRGAGVVCSPLAQLAAQYLPSQARRALAQQFPGDGLRDFLRALPPPALRGVVASLPPSAEVDAALLRALAVAGVGPEDLLEDLAEEDASVGPFFPELEPFGEWTKAGRKPMQ